MEKLDWPRSATETFCGVNIEFLGEWNVLHMISGIILGTLFEINLSTWAALTSHCAVCTTYLQHNHPPEIPSVHWAPRRVFAHEQAVSQNIAVACGDILCLLKLSLTVQWAAVPVSLNLNHAPNSHHRQPLEYIFGTQLVSRVVMAILGADESWGLDSVWDMIETKLSVSQPAVMAACPQHYTRARLTHKCQHIEPKNCAKWCKLSVKWIQWSQFSEPGVCYVDSPGILVVCDARGDTLHTLPQVIHALCFILSIVQRIYLYIYTGSAAGYIALSWVSVWECIHSDAPTERTLRSNLKCSVYGSVVVCLSIAINMLQIFYTFSILINAQNHNSAHADHFAEIHWIP